MRISRNFTIKTANSTWGSSHKLTTSIHQYIPRQIDWNKQFHCKKIKTDIINSKTLELSPRIVNKLQWTYQPTIITSISSNSIHIHKQHTDLERLNYVTHANQRNSIKTLENHNKKTWLTEKQAWKHKYMNTRTSTKIREWRDVSFIPDRRSKRKIGCLLFCDRSLGDVNLSKHALEMKCWKP